MREAKLPLECPFLATIRRASARRCRSSVGAGRNSALTAGGPFLGRQLTVWRFARLFMGALGSSHSGPVMVR